MALVTASKMILRSLRLLGEKIVGGTLSTAEQTDYLYDLNSFMDSVGLSRLMIPHLTDENFALTSSDGTYTIGPGADFSTTRPLSIENAFIRDSGGNDYQVQIIEKEQYNRIGLKTTATTTPEYLFYEPSVPKGTIYVYPEPGASQTLYISSWKPLQKFGGIDVPLQLPPGYQRFIEFNFAIDVAGGFTNVSQEVARGAKESRALVMGFNAPAGVLRMDAGVAGRRRYDINSDS